MSLFFKKIKFISQLILILGLVSCKSELNSQSLQDQNTGDRPLVVATTDVLCDLIKQVAQETIDLKCLVKSGIDPHVHQPTPGDRQIIDKANLIFYGGYNFDKNLISLVKATKNPAVKVAVYEKAVLNPLTSDDDHDHDHDKENHKEKENEKIIDPHIWHNPNNGIKIIEIIEQNLSTLQPTQQNLYQEKAKKLTAEITQIDQWIKQQIATIPKNQRKIITTHNVLGYYLSAYNLEFEGTLSGLNTQEMPTALRVSQLVENIKATNVPTIFTETSVNSKLIETVAKEAGIKVSERKLYADTLGEEGTDGETYQKMLIANTQAIVEGLEGKYEQFSTVKNQ